MTLDCCIFRWLNVDGKKIEAVIRIDPTYQLDTLFNDRIIQFM